MWKVPAVGLVLLCLLVGQARSLELKNIRPSYGPLGSERKNAKFLPKDYLFITYDIDGLKIEEKSRKASFLTTLEAVDQTTSKVIFKKSTPNLVEPMLGGTRIPGDLQLLMAGQAPGKYLVRLTITDNLAKDTKSFEYPFEILKDEFGVVGVNILSIGFPGQPYMAAFGLADMPLDAKGKPQVEVNLRILDSKGTAVTQALNQSWPRDLPDGIDLKKENFMPVQFPLYLNRAGSFFIELEAIEKIGKKKINMRFPLTVLDFNTIGK